MSSKFLAYGSGGADLTTLQDGTFVANLAEITDGSLTPNMPVLTDNRKKLISAKISNNELDTTLSAFVTDTNFKTLYINLPLSPEGTVFSNAVIADEFKIANGPSPPLFLLSDGTRTAINDNAFIILDSNPYNTFENIFNSLGDVFYNTKSSSVFGFQPPFRDEPAERILSRQYINVDVSTEAEFNNALNNELPPTYDRQITLIANITFTSAKTITEDIKITSDTGSRVITFSSATNIINFLGYYNVIDGVEFRNNNTGSNATCLAFSTTNAIDSHVKNCIFRTNEFAITSLNPQIQITDCFFRFDGTPDSHRYIALYKNTGNTIIARNQFSGNTVPSTACIFISSVAGSSFTNGKFGFNNNSTSASFPVQRLCIADAAFNVNDNLQFFIYDNTIQSSSGFMIFYNAVPMTGVLRIVAYNNIETLGGTATGSKGIIACDNISATTLPARTGPPYITTFNNTQPALRADYTGWTSDNNVAYNNTVISAAGNTPKNYSAVLQDIIGNDATEKVANINLPLEPFGTRFLNNIYADKFIVYNGPSPAGYLMSDGTVMTTSSSNINSNIYYYTNSVTTTAPPANGQIRFNNSVISSATAIFISHLTSDGTDIDAFLALISKLSIIYIQDRDQSSNYSRFNVNGTPTITPNSFVTLDVSFIEGGGVGTTGYPNNMNLFLSIFTNDVEIDTRLSNLETSTQNLTATSSDSTFIRPLKMGNNRIQTVGAPVDASDATNKSYVDNGLSTKLTAADLSTLNDKTQNITSANSSLTTFSKNFNVYLTSGGYFGIRSSDGLTNYMVVEPTISNVYNVLNMNSQKITSVGTATVSTDATNKNYVDTADALKLSLSGGTMSGILNMNNNKIIGLATPTITTDATTKTYVDTADALKLNLSGGTMTGNLTATNFIKSGGLSNQFLMANGGSSHSITTGSFNLSFAAGSGTPSAATTIYYTKIGVPNGVGLVTLKLAPFNITVGASAATTIRSTTAITDTGVTFGALTPGGAPMMSAPIKRNNIVADGWAEIGGDGFLNIYGALLAANYWTASTANCGLYITCQIVYMAM